MTGGRRAANQAQIGAKLGYDESLLLQKETDVNDEPGDNNAAASPRRSPTVHDLSALVTKEFDSFFAGTRRVVLVGYPEHHNVGDNAMWVATVGYLRSRGIVMTHSTNHRLYDFASVKQKVAAGAVLVLQGGGNFGDLWPECHELRERVAADFPDETILQLPQSVHFDDLSLRDRSLARLAAHRGFTTLARDEPSYKILSEAGVNSRLCPDAAHLLESSLNAAPGSGILVLARLDKERAAPGAAYASTWRDWDSAPRDLPEQLRRGFSLASRLTKLSQRTELRLSQPFWTALTKASLRRGVGLISRYETIVTDRLHAVLIARMLGRRVIAVDNSYGKISAYLDTWLANEPAIERAPDLSTGLELAKRG